MKINPRKIANKQEKRITKSLKEIGMEARQQMASGSIWFAKSDVISEWFQIEAKTRARVAKSISIKKEWLEKIEEEALLSGKIPVLVFSFGDQMDYFILKDTDFLTIIEELLTYRRR